MGGQMQGLPQRRRQLGFFIEIQWTTRWASNVHCLLSRDLGGDLASHCRHESVCRLWHGDFFAKECFVPKPAFAFQDVWVINEVSLKDITNSVAFHTRILQDFEAHTRIHQAVQTEWVKIDAVLTSSFGCILMETIDEIKKKLFNAFP